MKRLFFFLLIAACFSFYSKKKKNFNPPGTVQITETLFADETEVSNQSWGEYESWIKLKFGSNSPEYLATLPDTTVWRGTSRNTYSGCYYRHPAFKDYPVVGISYEQVLAFCKWRTERVKEYYAIWKKQSLEIEYTLPSKSEWELISNNGLEVLSNGGKNKKGLMRLNCSCAGDTLCAFWKLNEYAVDPDPVYSYWKNAFGLFNTFGNVAEMVIEKGISKGGSWRHTLEFCRVGKDISYEKPEAWLGFRCVCRVNKNAGNL